MSELVRSLARPLALIITLTGTVVLLALEIPVPDPWWGLQGTIVAFYFIQRHDEIAAGKR